MRRPRAVLMAMNCVRIMCPNLTCRKVLSVPEALRGKTVRCKNCMTNIRIPTKPGTSLPGKQQGAA